MNLGRYIAATSPSGIWDVLDLIGAIVKIKSLSVKSRLFGTDNEETHKITDIKFKLDVTGHCKTSIYLDNQNRSYEWKDLEILSVNTTLLRSKAICDKFNSDETVCGYNSDLEE